MIKRGSDEDLVEKTEDLTSQFAYYSLSRSFRGQNISYSISCSDADGLPSPCDGFAEIEPQVRTYDREIEVLGSTVTLLGFFVIEPTMLFFSNTLLYVYFPEKEVYKSIDLRDANFSQSLPVRYFMRSLTDDEGQVTNYMVYQNEQHLLGISLVYSTASFRNLELLKESQNFYIAEDTLYI